MTGNDLGDTGDVYIRLTRIVAGQRPLDVQALTGGIAAPLAGA